MHHCYNYQRQITQAISHYLKNSTACRQWPEESDFVARFCTRAILAYPCVFWHAQRAKKCDANHIPWATAYVLVGMSTTQYVVSLCTAHTQPLKWTTGIIEKHANMAWMYFCRFFFSIRTTTYELHTNMLENTCMIRANMYFYIHDGPKTPVQTGSYFCT